MRSKYKYCLSLNYKVTKLPLLWGQKITLKYIYLLLDCKKKMKMEGCKNEKKKKNVWSEAFNCTYTWGKIAYIFNQTL